jgi:ABC-2 type transport system permease protein
MAIAFLVLFVAIFGNGTMHVDGHDVKGSTYYVAALTVFAITQVAFTALVISLVERREHGVLRRRRATPQPAWTVVAGTAITSIMTGIVSGAVLLGVGRLAYGASVSPAAIPALLVVVAVGSIVFCCLGFALAGLVKSFDTAQTVATAAILPLMFISGVFVPWQIIPHWLQQGSLVFPVRPLAVAILDPYLAHGGTGNRVLEPGVPGGARGVGRGRRGRRGAALRMGTPGHLRAVRRGRRLGRVVDRRRDVAEWLRREHAPRPSRDSGSRNVEARPEIAVRLSTSRSGRSFQFLDRFGPYQSAPITKHPPNIAT